MSLTPSQTVSHDDETGVLHGLGNAQELARSLVVVALSMAQIASAYPTAHGLYHGSSLLGGRFWGWATAWINLMGLIFVTAGPRRRDHRADPWSHEPLRHQAGGKAG